MNHATPLASFFTMLLGQQLLQILSLNTVHVLHAGHLPISARLLQLTPEAMESSTRRCCRAPASVGSRTQPGVGVGIVRAPVIGQNPQLVRTMLLDLVAEVLAEIHGDPMGLMEGEPLPLRHSN